MRRRETQPTRRTSPRPAALRTCVPALPRHDALASHGMGAAPWTKTRDVASIQG